MATIFISYRRSTDPYITGRLRDQLARHFDVEDIFRDRESIQSGENWRVRLEESIGSAKVCLVVIGPEWLTVKDDKGQQRLFQSDDWVRLEIESALSKGIEVIPVLVKEAPLPKAESLPPSITGLLNFQIKRLSEDDWEADCQQLITRLQKLTGLTKFRQRMTAALVVLGIGAAFGLLSAAIELESGDAIAIDTHLGYLAMIAAGALVLIGKSFLAAPERRKLKAIAGVFGIMAVLGIASLVTAFAIWQSEYAAGLLHLAIGVAMLVAGSLFLWNARKIAK